MRDNKFHSVKPITDPTRPQLYIETYGCQMNVNDSEVVLSVMQDAGYSLCEKMEDADVILVNTCSIRENAEQRVFGRLDLFRLEKKRPRIDRGIRSLIQAIQILDPRDCSPALKKSNISTNQIPCN